MTDPLTCPGSGRTVSKARVKSGIYTTEWRTWCPYHLGTAPFRLAEVKPGGLGYYMRYDTHPPIQPDTKE